VAFVSADSQPQPGAAISPRPDSSSASFFQRPVVVFCGLALYFLLHILWRILVTDSVELDESEQVISVQSWGWGYAEQPPLYTWMLKLVVSACGLNVFSLMAFKSLLLFATYYFVYRAGKEIWDEAKPALLSALCLFFIPQISWESQRDLTHSVLATALAAVTLFVFLKLVKTGQGRWFAAFGICAGLGLLAKYNFILFIVALMIAALTLPEIRRTVFSSKLLISAWIGLAVAAPHLLWLRQHARESSIAKLTISSAHGLFAAYLGGAKSLIEGIGNFSAPILLIFALFFLRRKSERRSELNTEAKLVWRTVVTVAAICVLAVICFRAQFKPRWFQPLLFLLPIPIIAMVRSQLTCEKYRWLMRLACGVAVIILVVMPSITLAASITKRPNRLNNPWAELSRELKKKVNPAVIVADSCLQGGNLKMQFPNALALAPECKVLTPPKKGAWLIVWDANGGRLPPPRLEVLLKSLRKTELWETRMERISLPRQYSQKEFSLGYIVLPAPQ
jgi:lipopolysaccharide core galacturonosyltransferase RgtB